MSPAASRKVMIGTMLTRVEEGRRGSTCYNCRKAGHVARDMSKVKSEDEGEDRRRARERKVLGKNGGSNGGHPGEQKSISGPESFFDRARKRAGWGALRGGEARAAVVVAETKLASEGDTVRQAEARLLVLCQRANCVPESPPATIPANFMQELARLRDLVQELQQERDELRSEFGDQGQSAREDGRRKKSSKSIATPSPDCAQPQLNQIVTRGASGRNL